MRQFASFAAFAAALTLTLSGAAPALAASGHRPGHGRPQRPGYYLALGDSLSVGIQPSPAGTDVPTSQGYTDQLAAMLRSGDHSLRLVKLGCSGETTATFINGGICGYLPGKTVAGNQLTAATRFLRAHRGQVSLVTIDIGANDLNPCVALGVPAQVEACITQTVPQAVANLTTIMAALRQAGGSNLQIIGMRYYDPELADWLTGSAGQSFAQLSVSLVSAYNGYLAGVYQKYGASVADVFTAFHSTDFTDQVTVPGLGTVPRNVATICALTWECTPAPRGPNEHANAAGYRLIADVFRAVYRPACRR